MADQPPVPPVPPTPPPVPVPVPIHEGPVVVELRRGYEVQNWRPLVNWLLAIPHWIVLYILDIVAAVLWVISFFAVLFTRRNPFVGLQTMILRYTWRVYSFAGFMRNEYPPFDFATTPGQEVTDPAVLTIEDPGEMNRWLPLVKWLLVIPHLIVLTVLGIGVFVVHVIAFFAVLFTGRWPEGLRDFVVGYIRWAMRVNAYFYFLTDVYPPFSLQ